MKTFERIYRVVEQVPPGIVATYGQIAWVVGSVGPRVVGYALAALDEETDAPWFRIVNRTGTVPWPRQRARLAQEGIRFDSNDRLSFEKHGWSGPPWTWLIEAGFDIDVLMEKPIPGGPRDVVWQAWQIGRRTN